MMQPSVSIIVAVYNAEKYFERCLRSLFGQTAKEIEYVFVDDCTPDASFDVLERVLEEYPERKENVVIIHQEHNKGVAEARQIGMRASTGEYQIHCDPDDWMEPNAVETLYKAAKDEEADIVSGHMMFHYEKGEELNRCFCGLHKGRELVMNWRFNFSLCKQIIRTSLIKDNELYPWKRIGFGEDTGVTVRAFSLANKVVGLDRVIYHYDRSVSESLTHRSFVKLSMEADMMLKYLHKWMLDVGLYTSQEVDSFINKYKIIIKSELLKGKYNDLATWYKVWPDTVDAYIKQMPSRITKGIFCVGKIFPLIPYLYLRTRSIWK